MGHAVRRNETNLILHTCTDYELVHDIGIVNAIQLAWHSETAPMLFAHDAVWEQVVEPYAPFNGYVVGSNCKIQIHLQTIVSKSHLKDHHPSPVVTKRLLPQFAKAKLCKTFVAVSHFSCEACRSSNPAWHPEPPIGLEHEFSVEVYVSPNFRGTNERHPWNNQPIESWRLSDTRKESWNWLIHVDMIDWRDNFLGVSMMVFASRVPIGVMVPQG